MTKRLLLLLLASTLLLLLFFFLLLQAGKSKDSEIFSVNSFKSGNGWGYQIYLNEKMIIYQPYMPCTEGNEPFPDENSALMIAGIVIENLKKTGDPSITIDDLREIINIKE